MPLDRMRPSAGLSNHVPTGLLMLLLLLVAAAASADDCDHRADRDASDDLDGVTRVLIDVGAGSLEVTGVEGSSRLSAEGEACASSKSLLDDIRLETRRRGSTLELKADMPDAGGWGWGKKTARLDLRVELPTGIDVEIDDGSGSIEVTDVQLTDLDDGSGSITIRGGRVGNIDDGSGGLDLRGTAGDLRIDDGSGEIEITDHQGAVEITDGSGSLRLRTVTGDLRLDDGSGEIDLRDIRGNVVVRDGSGSIAADTVTGDFVVASDGSGGIRHQDVEGRVEVPSDD
ncbi:MAG: DUF4097 family beta strand repeat-containing protein [Acidobacteriota bacterium]